MVAKSIAIPAVAISFASLVAKTVAIPAVAVAVSSKSYIVLSWAGYVTVALAVHTVRAWGEALD